MIRALAALALLAAAPLMAQVAPPPAGKPVSIGIGYAIPSSVYGGERRLTVRLPAEYESEPERRFPVVYLLDGGPEQDFPHIAGLAQSREINGSFAPFILVGVETVQRRRELSPPVAPALLEAYRKDFGAAPGGAEQFRAFLAKDVKPWVAAHFRTDDKAALMGESLAALFVIDTLLTAPELFDDWIAASPSLWWDDLAFAKALPANLKAAPAGPERIYLALADEGGWMEEGVERLVDALREHAPLGWQWAYVPFGNSETHGTHYDLAALDAFRLFYGEPLRIYRPHRLIGGDGAARAPEEQALLDAPCTRANAIRTTPEATRVAQERLYYRCFLYDTGPRAREGNFER